MGTKRSVLGETLHLKRLALNLSQEKIAEMLSIKRSTYARYETTTVPPIDILQKIATIFEVTVDELLYANIAASEFDIPQFKPGTSMVKFSASSVFDEETAESSLPAQINETSGEQDAAEKDMMEIAVTREEYELLMFFRSCTPEQRKEFYKSKE